MQPVNISPVMNVFFQSLPRVQLALADKQITVSDAIDIAAQIAQAAAREAGVADKPLCVMKDKEAEG